jgi:CBS domain-containing membrane protein
MTDDSLPTTVGDIMTKRLLTIGEDDAIVDVRKHMETYRFRHLPVVRDTKLVGLITHRDMLHVASTPFSKQREVRDLMISYLPAKKVMRTEVATVTADTPLVQAGDLMWDMKVGCLCVTDEDDNLVGIVTEADFLRLAVRLVRKLGGVPKPPGPPPKKT